MMAYQKNIILFGIKLASILNKNLAANLFPTKKIQKIKIKSYVDEATGIHNKETPKAGSNYNSLVVITILLLTK